MSRGMIVSCLSARGQCQLSAGRSTHHGKRFAHRTGGQRARDATNLISGPQGLPPGRKWRGQQILCGFMACDPQLSRVFLGGLPPIIKVNIRDDSSGQWLENSIRHSVDNADASRPGGEAVLAKLSEVLFVETLRRYIALLPPIKRVAGRRPRPGSRESLGSLASQASRSLDDCRARKRGRNFAFRTGRALPALSLGNSDCLPHALAASTWRANAQIHKQ